MKITKYIDEIEIGEEIILNRTTFGESVGKVESSREGVKLRRAAVYSKERREAGSYTYILG